MQVKVKGPYNTVTHLLLLAHGQQNHNTTLPLPSCAAHALHQPDGGLGCIITDDQVHITNV